MMYDEIVGFDVYSNLKKICCYTLHMNTHK